MRPLCISPPKHLLINPYTTGDGKPIAESMGLVSGTVFLLIMVVTIPLFTSLTNETNNVEKNAGLFSICFAILLGLSDDLLDIKWKHKIFIVGVASLPLVVSYSGSTAIRVPSFFLFLVTNVSGYVNAFFVYLSCQTSLTSSLYRTMDL